MATNSNSYLTFKVGQEIFGINVLKVMEIREYVTPRVLPQSLPFVRGVIEYQDEVIPLIDTGLKFGLDAIKIDADTVMVVLQLISDTLSKTYRVAILVDAVSDVVECETSVLKLISDDYRPDYIQSTYTQNDKFIYILNSDLVFNQKEVISMLNSINKIK
jgi:purine-binding chemotaxis protein CheW